MGAGTGRAEIDLELVKWAHENLKNIPKNDGVYEEMISGVGHIPINKKYDTMRLIAHEKCMEYNEMRLKDFDNDVEKFTKSRQAILTSLLGKHGDVLPILEPPFYLDYGFNTSIGNDFFANFGCCFVDCSVIRIGDRCKFGPYVTIACANHPLNPEARAKEIEFSHPVFIEDDVWIGANACIIGGVTIGKGAVVAAGSVVTKDVPENTLVGGVPAKIIRTNLDTIDGSHE